ncbi:MAG: Abi family protein [Propionibacteriaceae bacterium]|nr:Abi family protein [Propionibacteriaceae bacterium]
MSTYAKPHLTYQQQLALIKSRGAACVDDARAIRLLQSVGYYNLTGYLYPFRQPDPTGQGRLDQFEPGTNLTDVEALVAFDQRLRTQLLAGIQIVEVAICARIAYVIGQRDKFGHVDRKCLDQKACTRRYSRGSKTDTAFNWWIAEYDRLQERAKKEPFVAHNLTRYGTPLPIWVAVEFFDFGAMSNLYQLLIYPDRQAIANAAGVPHESALRSWLKSLNHVRNVCAHNNRMWNRILMVRPSLTSQNLPKLLAHLGKQPNDKPYPVIAITAHLANCLRPDADWSQQMADVLSGFPAIQGRSISEMGVPVTRQTEALWATSVKITK